MVLVLSFNGSCLALFSYQVFIHCRAFVVSDIVVALSMIEDILFAVDSLVLLGFDMATTCLFC